MKNKVIVLVVISVLLCIFLPASILGTIHKINVSPSRNPNHELKYNGYLWFYDKNELMSKYECQTDDCDLATTIIDDNEYGINYYQDGNDKIGIVDGMFTFIKDGNIKLYNIQNGYVLQEYKAVKNYNITLENNYYILENTNEKWGVLSIGSNLGMIIPFEYDFVGLKNIFSDKYLQTEKFIVMKNNEWNLVHDGETLLENGLENPIIDYTDNHIFTKNNDEIKIFNYDGTQIVNNLEITDYQILDKYIAIFTDKILVIYDDSKNVILKTISNDVLNGEVSLQLNGDELDVLIDNEIIEKIVSNS